MSGGQIGTVVGGAIGAYFGGVAGAQIGMAIGGMVGGLIDPTKIRGPHIGDGLDQSATDGTPIAWIQGKARTAGTIVAVSPRREVKKKDDGKGSGTETTTYEAHQDFAILICESSELYGSTIAGILRVEQDGKIVYDASPDSTIVKDSFKFSEGVDYCFGGEDQLPHPTLEAIFGVGNTLAYRGYLVAVFKDFNLTAVGDRIPSFVFTLQSANLNLTSYVRYNDMFKYEEVATPDPGPWPPYSPGFDDTLWHVGQGGFGDQDFFGYKMNTPLVDPPGNGSTVWLRKPFYRPAGDRVYARFYYDDFGDLWVNGVHTNTTGQTGVTEGEVPIEALVDGINMFVYRVYNIGPAAPGSNHLFCGLDIWSGSHPTPPTDGTITLGDVVNAVCVRGGISLEFIDASELYDDIVIGYPIAVQGSGTDCLAPLLAAYFCYGSEYDGKIHFRKLGQDATVTINPLDLIESDTGTDGASVTSTKRNQETEYPYRMTASYYDPDQNYQPVTTTYQRNSADVTAIGVQTFQIPVVMTATQATQAAVKALKAAFAALEGTEEYSLPLIGRSGESYLSIAAGDPVFFRGKRWLVDECTISHNMMHIKSTYNRQSAYTTNIQPIPSPPVIPPRSRDGGVSTLYAMNLPSLRPQDTYGLYLAVSGEEDAWDGAQVQVSLDSGQSWQDGVTVKQASVMGTLTADASNVATTISVAVNGDLTTITPEQIAARGNAFAILSSADAVELGQFRVETETSTGHYDLTELSRGLMGTTVPALHLSGERFTMLDSVYFLPLDLLYGETIIQLRAVTLGGKAEDATVVSIVYRPDDQVILDGGGDPL